MDLLTVSLDREIALASVVDDLLSLAGARSRARFAARGRSGLQSLVAEVAARYLLSRSLSCAFDDTQVERSSSGRPRSGGMTLTMSHSGDMVAVAICQRAVGVDVQQVRRVRADLAERFFLPSETARIQTTDPAVRNSQLIELWTRKESFAKFDGRGLRATIDQFGIGEGTGPLLPMVDECGAPIGVETMLHATAAGFTLASCAASGTIHSAPVRMTASTLVARVAHYSK